jgi:DNA (cytosine-5)-methyltransferase 3A
MACGMIAMRNAGIEVESYDAYEIDEYAIKVSTHNFPEIKQHGDVFKGDFTQFEGVDWVIGGSPCTHWSIAQKNNRETTASGIGWELFQQYVRAIKEAKPKYFLYENNKSMSKEIKASITREFALIGVDNPADWEAVED